MLPPPPTSTHTTSHRMKVQKPFRLPKTASSFIRKTPNSQNGRLNCWSLSLSLHQTKIVRDAYLMHEFEICRQRTHVWRPAVVIWFRFTANAKGKLNAHAQLHPESFQCWASIRETMWESLFGFQLAHLYSNANVVLNKFDSIWSQKQWNRNH